MLQSANAIAARLEVVRADIAEACRPAGRDPSAVTIVAVTKGQPVQAVEAALRAGLRDIGENYVQELERKRGDVAASDDVRWHFLGRVQSNKARRIASCHLVHGVEPGSGARRLARIGEERGDPVRCLVEVDATGRRQGVAAGELGVFVEEMAAWPGIEVRGLMTVAPETASPEEARTTFRDLRALRDRFVPGGELSMGMSMDLQVAVEEGATMVRVGRALFGDRPERRAAR